MDPIRISQTTMAKAVEEMLEDRYAEVVKHCRDVTTIEEKPCTISIKVTVIPDKRREKFDFKVSSGVQLSPREAADGTLYASVNEQGEVEVAEFNSRLPLDFNRNHDSR